MENTTPTLSQVGEWINSCREVNGTWRSMVWSNILAASLDLDNIFEEDSFWYEEWYERFNDLHDANLTVEEFQEEVRDHIQSEVEHWYRLDNLMTLTMQDWYHLEIEAGATWEDVKNSLEASAETNEKLREYIDRISSELEG